MNEPTVLDYFKSIFKDWKSFTTFLRAWADRADTTQMVETSPLEEIHPQNVESSTSDLQPSTAFPWRSLLALLIALAAQRMFEPPDRNAILGVSLYIAALGLVIWAFVRGELKAAPLPASQVQRGPAHRARWNVHPVHVFGTLAFHLMWN